MIIFGIALFVCDGIRAQEDYSFADVTRLTNLYKEVQSGPSRSVCFPWASTMRLRNIKENNEVMTDILSFENLWIALHETCLKGQRTSTQLDVTLDKRGRIKSILRNGKILELDQFGNLRRQKFPKHKSQDGKLITIYTSVG